VAGVVHPTSATLSLAGRRVTTPGGQEQSRPPDVPPAGPLSEFSAAMPPPSTALPVSMLALTSSTRAQGSAQHLGNHHTDAIEGAQPPIAHRLCTGRILLVDPASRLRNGQRSTRPPSQTLPRPVARSTYEGEFRSLCLVPGKRDDDDVVRSRDRRGGRSDDGRISR